MVFTTFTFVLFLLAAFPIYWSIRSRTGQNLFIVLASYFFYGWWDYRFCSLMMISSLIDYVAGMKIDGLAPGRKRRAYLILSMTANLGMLGFFKYFNFFTESAATILTSMGFQANVTTLGIVLPVGISFYTFQTMCYTLDIYQGRLKACHSLIDYLAYVSFFPQLVAGPIERAGRLLAQFNNPRTFDAAQATDGCRQMLWGFFKKMVIADNLSPFVDVAYTAPEHFTGAGLLLATTLFGFQIYCDFSGYSDIAIGLGKLFGINLMRNFAYPYFSQSIDEFWRRWHISLSTWFRDYVYHPLGGSRVSRWKQARNILITFTLSGLWHGASWNFVIWGALHGLAILPVMFLRDHGAKIRASDPPGGAGLLPHPMTVVRILLTFAFTTITWVFFRSQDFGITRQIFGRIFSLAEVAPGTLAMSPGGALSMGMMSALLGILIVAEWLAKAHQHPLQVAHLPRIARWAVYTVIFWAIMYLGTHVSGQFIYFQF